MEIRNVYNYKLLNEKINLLLINYKKMISTLPKDLYGYIYKLTSEDTNKSYIGQTLSHTCKNDKWIKTGIDTRIKLHLRDSKNFPERPLYKDINLYTIDRFDIEIIHKVSVLELNKLDYLEHEEIKKNNTKYPYGYNITDNTVSNKGVKAIVIKALELNNIEPEYVPKTRKERRQQVLINIKNRDVFFKGKNIEKITIKKINNSKYVPYIRVNIYIKDVSDIYRCDFYPNKNKKTTFEETYKIALCFSNSLVSNESLIEVSSNIKNTYKYNDKLMSLEHNIITTIIGKVYTHKQSRSKVYVLFFRGNNKEIKIQFGGRKTTEESTLIDVLEFIGKIKAKHFEIENINIKQLIKSCLQQQATTKVANIIFVEE
jgi:hypothetical protein